MGKKYASLKDLVDKKINVHSFENVNQLSDLINYADSHEKFSMRFDKENDYYQLPFYKFDKMKFVNEKDRNKYLSDILEEANRLNCSIVCSNGYLYDDVQICNFVINIDLKSNFVLEFCTKKVSLREMYEYKTTIVTGNIQDALKDMEWVRKESNSISNSDIEKIINWSFNLNIINKNIEATLYQQKVGILKDEIVCWQID